MNANTYLINYARAWVKRRNGPDEVVRILLDAVCADAILCYQLYTAYDENPDYLGRILFDAQGYWIMTVPTWLSLNRSSWPSSLSITRKYYEKEH